MSNPPLTTRDEPKTNEYAGDEVSAVILDPGYSSCRAGFAGEDTPKSIVPSFYASYPGHDASIYGDYIQVQPDISIKNPYSRDGIVEDWDAAEELWKHSFASKLTGVRPNKALQEWLNDPKPGMNLQQAMKDNEDTEKALEDHPLFMSEPNNNPSKNREKALEIALEKWAAPAFYISKSSVLAAFSSGKSSALVIDIGASGLSIAAVHDGMILKKSIQRSHLGGNYISEQIRNNLFSHEPPVTITPHYLVKSKSPVEPNAPSAAVLRTFPSGYTPPQESYRRHMEEKTLLEFKECCLQTWNNPTMPFRGQGEALAREQYLHPFEFPDGFNTTFGSERFRIVETLFDAQCHTSLPSSQSQSPDMFSYPPPEQKDTLPQLIKSSLAQTDIDIRPLLLSNVVLTGSGSLIRGLPDRVNAELTRMYPSTKVRLSAAGLPVERKYGAWLGGSIVASLGTFHQMWISRREYEEVGSGIVEKRCK